MPRTSSSGSFAGVYAVGSSTAAVDESTYFVGAVMVFQQTAAPTGWTKITSYDDFMLTQTSGNVVANSTGRFAMSATLLNFAQSFTATMAGPISVGPATLSVPQFQPHSHQYTGYPARTFQPGALTHTFISTVGGFATSNGGIWNPGMPIDTHPGGAASAHVHPYQIAPYTGPSPAGSTSKDMRIKYVDCILASRN